MATNMSISTDTACPWDVDLNGAPVTVDYAYADNAHRGTITLRSTAIFSVGNHIATFSGPILGTGKLKARMAGIANNQRLLLTNSLSAWTGGFEVITNIAQAAAPNALGKGHVHVDGAGTLETTVPGTFYLFSRLYLDYDSLNYGKISIPSASTTTRVARAFTGGTGGWEAPVGYAELAPGLYSNASPGLANYIIGSGTLLVQPPPWPGCVFSIK